MRKLKPVPPSQPELRPFFRGIGMMLQQALDEEVDAVATAMEQRLMKFIKDATGEANYITEERACEMLGCSKRKLDELRRDPFSKLVFRKAGRTYQYLESTVRAFNNLMPHGK